MWFDASWRLEVHKVKISWLLLYRGIAKKFYHLKKSFSLLMHIWKKYWIHSYICIMYVSYNKQIHLSCCWGDWFSSNSRIVKNNAAVLNSDCDDTLAFCWISWTISKCMHPSPWFHWCYSCYGSSIHKSLIMHSEPYPQTF